MEQEMQEWQDELRAQLSDIDAPVMTEDGVHTAQWRVYTALGTFPCSSLSLALAVTQTYLRQGGSAVEIKAGAALLKTREKTDAEAAVSTIDNIKTRT